MEHIGILAHSAPYPIPGLHIADIVAGKARSEGRNRVALLGTRWPMEGPCYPAAFARAGVGLAVPEPEERGAIHRVIFEELCQGVIRDESRARYVRIIERMKRDGCDAVALACTEIPLLVSPEVSPLPVFDSTRLLAHAAVARALSSMDVAE